MNIKDLVFYKKKGFLVKKGLIPKQLIIKINRKINNASSRRSNEERQQCRRPNRHDEHPGP